MTPSPGSPAYYTVVSAQAGLRALNYGPIQVDGYFGPQTRRAVVSFQNRKGLTTDGTIGPETWRALHSWSLYYTGNCP